MESALEEQESGSSGASEPAPILAFNDYELLEEIARGGMGVVYRARQVSLNRIVAIKMILGGHLASAAELKRFRAEAQTAAQLQHPHIVAIHEVGEHAGQPFFSMDLVEGKNLAHRVHDEALPSSVAAGYLKTIAEAVHYAHSRGVLHRDLKPSNILIDQNNQPRITDFGLAKRLEDSQLSNNELQLTQTGQVLGSPSFIPPEQATGRREAFGPASDVYSLGAILYHCLTGRPPFVAETMAQTLRLVAEQEPVSPRLLNASVPRDLETICLKCLEKDVARRYPTALELAEDLGRFLANEPIHARPVSAVGKVQRWCLRNKALAAAGSAILVLLLLVAVGSPIALVRINRERTRAEANAKQAKSEAARSQQVAKFLRATLSAAGPSVARGRDATILREILDKAIDRVGKEIIDEPEVQGDMWLTLAGTYDDIGDGPRTVQLYEKAVETYRAAFHGDNKKLAQALSSLGQCQSKNGDVTNGNQHALLGLEMARRCGDKEILIHCLFNAASSFNQWTWTSQSEAYLREALELQKQSGADPVGIATTTRMLSAFVTNDVESEKMIREALATHQKHLPPDHRLVADDVFVLAQQLHSNGKLEEAEEKMRETVQLFHKIFDVDHTYQGIAVRLLADILIARNKLKETEALLRENMEAYPSNVNYYHMLALFRMHFGSLNPVTGTLPRGVEEKLAKGELVPFWAVSLLLAGDEEQFQQYRHRYLEAALAQPNFEGKLETAKTLLLCGGTNEDLQQSYRFADMAIKNAAGDYNVEGLKALLEIRRGNFRPARAWANQVVIRDDGYSPRVCEGWFIKALACARLQQPLAARAALTKGEELLKKNWPEKKMILLVGYEWIFSRYLGNQASQEVAQLPESSRSNEESSDTADDLVHFINNPEERVIIFTQRGKWLEAALELPRVIDIYPTNAGLHLRQGELFGRVGHFKDAVLSLKQSAELSPNARPYFLQAPTLLYSGDFEGYRQVCHEMVTRYRGTKDIGEADTTAKSCLLDPRSGIELSVSAGLAETAVSLGAKSEYFPWFELCKSLAEYRQAHFADAVTWATNALRAAGPIPERDAAAWLIVAMAKMKLRETSPAQEALDKAKQIVGEKLPKMDSSDLGVQWIDRIIAELLLREAEALFQPERAKAGG